MRVRLWSTSWIPSSKDLQRYHTGPFVPIICLSCMPGSLCRQQGQMIDWQALYHDVACPAGFQAPAGDYPPYPVWNGNEYQGWLWTMENDKFDRSNVRPSPS